MAGNNPGRLTAARAEYKKVSWPTRSEIVQYTLVVLAVAVVVALFCWVLDLIFGWLIGLAL